MAGKWWEGIAGFLGELGGSKWKGIRGWNGLVSEEKEGEVLLKIRGRRKGSLLGNSLDFSALSLGRQKKGNEGGRMAGFYQEEAGCWRAGNF